MASLKLNDILEKRLDIQISFQNLTSQSNAISEIKLVNLEEKSCTISIGTKTCTIGHQILIKFAIRDITTKNSQPKIISLTGKITDKNPSNDTESVVYISFQQFVKEEWKLIHDIYEKKQKFVDDILKQLKQV